MVENDLDALLATARAVAVEEEARDNPEMEMPVAPEDGDLMGAVEDPAVPLLDTTSAPKKAETGKKAAVARERELEPCAFSLR